MGIEHCHSYDQQPCKCIGTQGTQQTQRGMGGEIYNSSLELPKTNDKIQYLAIQHAPVPTGTF